MIDRTKVFAHEKPREALIISFLIVFFFGFIVGREEVKYEIRSAFATGLSQLQNAFNNPGQLGSQDNVVPIAPQENPPVLMTFISKNATRDSIGQLESVDTSVKYTNNANKDIKAFIGVITFSDLFDRTIKSVNTTFEEGLKVGETKQWNGTIRVNMFDQDDKRLASIDLSAMKVSWRVSQIIFADGTKQSF